MTPTTTRSLLGHMLGDTSAAHPHLALPVNSHAFARERATAIQGLEGLMAYQRFLADARSVKAQRRRVSKAFESRVQAQSRHALLDLNGFMGSALRTAGQVDQNEYWHSNLQRIAAALNDTGPTTAQELWRDIRGRADVMSMLAGFGFSDSMAAMTDQTIAATDIGMRTTEGRVEIVTRGQSGGEEGIICLTGRRARPKNVAELLGHASFDQLATAFSQPGDGYIPAVSAASPHVQPSELLALAAFVSRQLLVDHVRKLEDTGLATHTGGEPGTLLVLLLIGVTLYLSGLWIADMCTDPQVINPPSDTTCVVGGILTILGAILIAGAFGGAGVLVAAGASTLAGTLIALGLGWAVYGVMFWALLVEANFAGAFDGLLGFDAPNLAEDPP